MEGLANKKSVILTISHIMGGLTSP
jgi:hypothetical protein